MISFGSDNISGLYIGSQEVTKAYLGDALVWEKSSGTVYDYLSPYLWSDGNPYIELPILASEVTDCIEIEFQLDEANPMQRFYAPAGGETVFQGFVSNNTRVGYTLNGAISGNNGAQPLDTERHTLKVDYPNRIVTLDGTKTVNIGTSTKVAETNLSLLKPFAAWPRFVGRLFAVRYWRSGVQLYDMAPAVLRRTGYLYDTISGSLFGNVGSGSFGYGGHTFDSVGKLLIDADGKYLDVKLYNTINL